MSKARLVHLEDVTLGVTMLPGPKFTVLVGEPNKVADADGSFSLNLDKSKDITEEFRQIYEFISAEQAANIAMKVKTPEGPKPIVLPGDADAK